jgi:hypothetical protein
VSPNSGVGPSLEVVGALGVFLSHDQTLKERVWSWCGGESGLGSVCVLARPNSSLAHPVAGRGASGPEL